MMMKQMQTLRQAMERQFAASNRLTERFLAEVEFAHGLAKLSGQTSDWTELIGKALDIVAEAVHSSQPGPMEPAVIKAENLLSPIAKVAKTYTIHCVGHAHIDLLWTWPWAETVAVANDTFTTVLKLMEEFSDFCFTQSQISVYEIIREHNPELFQQIKRRIAEGRWEIAAVNWVEGDKNLVSGESLTRQLLYARRYAKEHFGLEPEDMPLDWSPDTFGHAHTVPMINSRGGARRYYMCRGGRAKKPPVFWWKGPDGSRVLVYLERTWYWDHIGTHNIKGMLRFCKESSLKDWMLVYGVGDHGGGPTRRDIRMCYEMNSWPVYPNFQLTTTGGYYDFLEMQADRFPELDGELNFEFTGCYSSQSYIKKTYRSSENYLQEAETAATLAYRALGWSYPTDKLRKAWIDTLFGQFHDVLSGSCTREGVEYHSAMAQETGATTGMIKTNSLRALGGAIDTSFAHDKESDDTVPGRHGLSIGSGAGCGTHFGEISAAGHADTKSRAFVAFNLTSWDRDEIVKVRVWDSEDDDVQKTRFVARTSEGNEIHTQKVSQGEYHLHRYVELAFPVSVSAMGYSAFVIEEVEAVRRLALPGYEDCVKEELNGGVKSFAQWYPSGEDIFTGEFRMENESLSVELDRFTGGIAKLVDKTTGKDVVAPDDPCAVLEYILEQPAPMSAWLIRNAKKRICPLELESLHGGMTGPYIATFEAKYRINESVVVVTYILSAGQPCLEISISAEWRERGGPNIGTPTLRMQFPLALTNSKMRCEIPYGSIERSLHDGEEVPALRWVDVVGKDDAAATTMGCALLNDCTYGYSLDGAVLRVTLIRSSYDPDPFPELGKHQIRLALVPHSKHLTVSDLVRLGASFNHPLQVVATDIHKGRLPSRSERTLSSTPANVIVTSVKRTEDSDAVIFRVLETVGETCIADIALHPNLMGKVAEAVEVDLMEREIESSTAEITKAGFTVQVPAKGIATVKVTFENVKVG